MMVGQLTAGAGRGAGGRLPIRPRCRRVYGKINSFIQEMRRGACLCCRRSVSGIVGFLASHLRARVDLPKRVPLWVWLKSTRRRRPRGCPQKSPWWSGGKKTPGVFQGVRAHVHRNDYRNRARRPLTELSRSSPSHQAFTCSSGCRRWARRAESSSTSRTTGSVG